MSTTLSASFEYAGIPLEIVNASTPDLFQLDVADDRVRLWPGEANEIDVLSFDPFWNQAVLLVKEAPRARIERIRVREGRVTREQVEAFIREGDGGRVLRSRGSSWLVERMTEPAERRFLIGFDDLRLFAAQLPSGSTVAEAHEALKPEAVKRAPSAVRQGEWFFIPATRREEREILSSFVPVFNPRRGGPLPGEGSPHWAEELVALPAGRDPATGEWLRRLFVRGRVRHRDHRTLSFDAWRAVHLNTAIRRRRMRAEGFYWID